VNKVMWISETSENQPRERSFASDSARAIRSYKYLWLSIIGISKEKSDVSRATLLPPEHHCDESGDRQLND
jgi:hypothetical protein